MKRILASTMLITPLTTIFTSAHACGMPAAPDGSLLMCLGDPVEILFVIFTTLAIGAAVGPSILKGLGKLGRSKN